MWPQFGPLVPRFGFASGLVSLGLPQGDIPLALLRFNVGSRPANCCRGADPAVGAFLPSSRNPLVAAGADDASLFHGVARRLLDRRPVHDRRYGMTSMTQAAERPWTWG